MEMHRLVAHGAHPPRQVAAIGAGMAVRGGWLVLRWRLDGAGLVVAAPFIGRQRRDGLWRHTCFELFVAGPGPGYAEFNFSPSEGWAAYDFADYRAGMAKRPIARAPVCDWREGRRMAIFDAAISLADLPAGAGRAALSAVIEEEGGHKSYWALAHGGLTAPDFHAPDGFTLAWPPGQTAD